MDTANQLCSDLELEDRAAPVGDSTDPILSMPIKLLRRRNKKNVTNLGVSVRRSTKINNFKKGLKWKGSFGIVMGLETRPNTL
jgi:hypothetical protein